MQDVVGSVAEIKFDIEVALENQYGAQALPFPGMDKSGSAVCTFYLRDNRGCNKGDACPFRHLRGDRTVVCKHWLRRLCKKGDDCEFLHEYDMTKMPECYFFSKFGQCGNKDCPFLHIDPEKKVKDCPWYDRGYCRHGAACNNRHIRRIICQNYLCGFCLDGPSCKFVHARYDIPPADPVMAAKKASLLCHFCNEYGHKAAHCPKVSSTFDADKSSMPPASSPQQQQPSPTKFTHSTPVSNMRPSYHPRHQVFGQPRHPGAGVALGEGPNTGFHHAPGPRTYRPRRPLEEITCYKCGGKGHFAHKCSKGYLAFLSNSANTVQGQLQLQQQQLQQQQPPPQPQPT